MRWFLVVLMAVVSGKCFGQGSLLFEADDPQFGPKSLTVDSRTGLVFLDLTLSMDRSVEQVRQAMLPGGEFFGFRHVTPQEVTSLYLTAGFTPSFIPVGSPQFASVLRLMQLMGTTYEVYGHPALAGIMSDRTWSFIMFSVPDSYYVSDPAGFLAYAGVDYRSPGLGHWLVVPEPTSGCFFALGLGFIVICRRMR